jgi:hypothetical protein
MAYKVYDILDPTPISGNTLVKNFVNRCKENLDAKKNHGAEEDRARDLFYALWVSDLFMEKGAKSVRAFCTHAVLSGPAYERLSNSAITELIVTDTIPLKQQHDKIRVLPVADLFADVIRRMVNNQSISSHFIIS